jgi:hypothetical protein
VSEKDEEFFRLIFIFPAFWSIDSDQERTRAMLAAASATAETKVAKVFLVGDNTYASTGVPGTHLEEFS